jgi:hypothetical protein
MKSILLLFAFALFLSSCNNDDIALRSDLPTWLVKSINEDEAKIKSDPSKMSNYGAWFKYSFQGEYYYEYDNPLSSLIRNPYSQEGVSINTTVYPFTKYWDEKCCEELIWKAPNYNSY